MDRKHQAPDLEELLQHSAWIQGLAYATVRDYALAEDVSQEVLLKALMEPRRTGRIQRSWLAAVTKNLSRNYLRGINRRRKREEFAFTPEGQSGHDSDFLAAHRQLSLAVDQLTEKSRRIILLRFFQDKSISAIAKELKISQNNARVRLHRALAELRSLFEGKGVDWKNCCGLLAPWSLGIAKAVSGGMAIRWVACIAVLLLGSLAWVQGFGQNEEFIADDFIAMSYTPEHLLNGEETQQQALNRIKLAPAELLQEKNSRVHIQWVSGLVRFEGLPVANAEVSVFQDSDLQMVSSDEAGVFRVRLNVNRRSVVSARAEVGGATLEVFQWPKIIDLSPRPPGGRFLKLEDWLEQDWKKVARVRVYIDQTGDPFAGLPRRDDLELIVDADMVLSEPFPIPQEAWFRATLIEVEAEGYLPISSYIDNFWLDNGDYRIELWPGETEPVQLLSQDRKPFANAEIYLGFPMLEGEKTNPHGFIPKTSWWSEEQIHQESGGGWLPARILMKLPDGRFWYFSGRSQRNDRVVKHLGNKAILIDESPVRVRLAGMAIPEGCWIEVASTVRPFKRALVQANFSSSSMVGSSAFLGDPWHKIGLGETVTLEKGVIGTDGLVLAKVMPGGSALGPFSIEDGLSIVELTLKDLTINLIGFEESAKYRIEIGFSGGTNHVRFESGTARLFLNRRWDRAAISKLVAGKWVPLFLPELNRTRGFDPKQQVETLDVNILDQEITEVEVMVNGVPVIGGHLGAARISVDGKIHLPLQAIGSDSVHCDLNLPPILHLMEGGKILLSSFYLKPAPSVRNRKGLSAVIDLKLASVEILLPKNEEQKQRSLSIVASGKNPRIKRIGSGTDWPPEPSMAWGDGNPLLVPQQGGWLKFRIPEGRYLFKVGQLHGLNGFSTTYGKAEGIDVDADRINVIYPDEEALR